MKSLIAVVFAVSALSGCANMSPTERNVLGGAAIGAVAGQLIGGNTASVIGGAAVGGLIGSQIQRNGRTYDHRGSNDRRSDCFIENNVRYCR